MSTEKNKAIIRRVTEAWNEGNLAIFDELFATDCILGDRRGVEASKQVFIHWRNAFPDSCQKIEDMVAEGDKVWVRGTFTGTHKGEIFGVPPTGKQVTVKGFRTYRLADGKIVEHWGLLDTLSLRQQMGAIPSPG